MVTPPETMAKLENWKTSKSDCKTAMLGVYTLEKRDGEELLTGGRDERILFHP